MANSIQVTGMDLGILVILGGGISHFGFPEPRSGRLSKLLKCCGFAIGSKYFCVYPKNRNKINLELLPAKR